MKQNESGNVRDHEQRHENSKTRAKAINGRQRRTENSANDKGKETKRSNDTSGNSKCVENIVRLIRCGIDNGMALAHGLKI
jgi:hypothetical protein